MLDNIDRLQNLGFSSEFDIQPYLLSEDEVAKKIIMAKAPNMRKEDVDLIIDSEEVSINKVIKEIEDESENDESTEAAISEEEKARRRERRKEELERRKELRRQQIQEMKQIYKDKIVEFKEQAKNILKEIKMAFYNLVRQAKALIKKSITSITQAGSSLAAIAVIIAAPPWNIPLAISYTMAVVDILLTLISELKAILPFTTAFDKLRFVSTPKNLSIISNIINVNLEIVINLWSKLSSIESLVNTLLNKILELLSGTNKGKTFKKAEKKLRKLGHFRGNEYFDVDGLRIRADSDEDAYEIKSILDVFVVNYSNETITDYKKDNSGINAESLLNDLKNKITQEQNSEVPINIESTLYDVRLPNGTVLRNQTDDDLEELKKVYTIVLEQIGELNQNI
jgi:hypothetical protein